MDYPKRGHNIPCDFKPKIPQITYKKKENESEYNKEEYEKRIENYEKNKYAIERGDKKISLVKEEKVSKKENEKELKDDKIKDVKTNV